MVPIQTSETISIRDQLITLAKMVNHKTYLRTFRLALNNLIFVEYIVITTKLTEAMLKSTAGNTDKLSLFLNSKDSLICL